VLIESIGIVELTVDDLGVDDPDGMPMKMEEGVLQVRGMK
jgi:hypothetical protein